jgi:nicotinate-nucleotide--dimethylbenzimidazole phosphoribosyltransferase
MTPPRWLEQPIRGPDAASNAAARARQESLTKPPGSLGELENVAVQLAGWQGRLLPRVDRVHISVFAADHGVTAEGVSAFPAAVTAEMIRNFTRGGAAINVLARALGASLEVINLGTLNDAAVEGCADRELHLGAGTANFATGPAMTSEQLAAALDAGRESVERAQDRAAELYIGGEMGIGNTTAASAIACALLGAPAAELVGPGTGLSATGVAHKAAVIERALAVHRAQLQDPYEVLRRLGGFEIAALAGAYLRCAQLGVPALVDGFIASTAALTASRLEPRARAWWLFGHRSREPGHAAVLAALEARPLLDLGLRLGEGSGAACAVPLLRLACELHAGMSTFAQAGVSGRIS